MTITARTICEDASRFLNAIAQAETLSASLADFSLRRLNQLVNSWATLPLTIPFIAREVFSVVASQASYTMGPGGNFNTTRPVSLEGAGLLLTNVTPNVEIPRQLLTDDMYEAIAIKDLTNPYFTSVYFNATYAGDLATVILWPVPTDATTKVVLYRESQTAEFADLDTSYQFPPGYAEALTSNLAKKLSTPLGLPLPTDIEQMARETLGQIKRSNVRLTDVASDAAALGERQRGMYNILTGQ